MATSSQGACADPMNTSETDMLQQAPQMAVLDVLFPGFSVFSTTFHKYFGIDLNVYIPLIIFCGGATFAWRYFSDYLWEKITEHLMSTVEVRTDDEIYNILMSWVAAQRFAQNSRRFIVNTNLNSRSWFLWRWDDDQDSDDDTYDPSSGTGEEKKKPLAYTPSFGSHSFWYRGHLLLFKRSQNQQQTPQVMMLSDREEISISCFGRNPWILKELLQEARANYLKNDSRRTMIYRASVQAGTSEPMWQRCMARTSRPFSTVILNEQMKENIVKDVRDYLSPATRKWYSNRGIPWRRGYLLTGPPGTGKSSLSLALAGYFKMRIYIVSLSSITASEENLSSLFAELPRRCVVLLEDIDTAGLTHTREENGITANSDVEHGESGPIAPVPSIQNNQNAPPPPPGRLSLSGLLNILDGVASQEGRVLIMTTNHVEKLDRALIRPGRVDLVINFSLADEEIIRAMFRAIYAPLEADEKENAPREQNTEDPEAQKALAEREARLATEINAQVDTLAEEFVTKIPAHEFSPAEIQGFLLKHKHSVESAVAAAADWVVQTRKEKKDKVLKDAEEKRKADAAKKEQEEKKRKEEEETKEEEKTEEGEKEDKEPGTNENKEEGKKQETEKANNDKRSRVGASYTAGSDSLSGSGSEASAEVTVSVTPAAGSGEDQSEKQAPVAEEVKVAEGGDEGGGRKRDSGYGTSVEV